DGSFAAPVNYSVEAVIRSLSAADLDGDGDIDLAGASYASNTVSVLRNNGDGTFVFDAETYGAGVKPRSVIAADLDGDGDMDVATANEGSNSVSILTNLSNRAVCPFEKGDLSGDAFVTLTDAILLVNCAFSGFGNCNPCFADLNCDSNLSPTDVIIELLAVYLDRPFPCL
ncbi:MAG: VCBS repeat-containing protein, partial [candidate division Zixibacteria bacterium]|nr:VCBS repeat-containing protein [candidate division Zixibacteria bacterium]